MAIPKEIPAVERPSSEIYSFRQVLRYLRKCMKVRVGDSDKWKDNTRLKYVQKLYEELGV